MLSSADPNKASSVFAKIQVCRKKKTKKNVLQSRSAVIRVGVMLVADPRRLISMSVTTGI